MQTQHFVRTQYAKLSWKLLKHSIGVLTMSEEREGREPRIRKHSTPTVDVQYLETPIRP